MNKKEKDLFIELCSFKNPSYSKIERLLGQGYATPSVLGMLLANRMAGVALDVLKKGNLLDRIDREFRNTLRNVSMIGKKQNEDFEVCLVILSKLLDSCNVPYALLKGAYLFWQYPEGARTSNDVDILVSSANVDVVSEHLKRAGFQQGYLKNGIFMPATRRQIIESKINRGETVPFVKEMNLPFMRYLEVDVNFSLDYKNGNESVLHDMLSRTERIVVGSTVISTLDKYDFLIHLCSHLYKEATTMPWIQMNRDMTFYKYCDIYTLLYNLSEKESVQLIVRAEQCENRTEFLYCLKSVASFFKIRQKTLLKYLMENILDCSYVISPAEHKLYRYKIENIQTRFFKQGRMKLLEEVRF